ncbi:DUF167 domain-containing protein [Adhaeretor mobilis]|uniref:DUF167 domain-containing protein n=1 Tax=Adhaeretor mobilis TaxID=1930276 RepID=UPI001C54CB3F
MPLCDARVVEVGSQLLGEESIRLSVKVVPSSSKNCVAEWLGDVLKLRVTAPPERGKANLAVEATLALALDLPTGAVRVIRGKTSPRKVVQIDDLSESEVFRRLGRGAV